MSSVDTRNVPRESLFLFAEVMLDGMAAAIRVKVRNLSSGGMMGEAGSAVTAGEQLTVVLRNIGGVRGTVAWVEGSRFGIAFEREIDPAQVRAMPAEPKESTSKTIVPGSSPGSSGFKLRPV